MSQGVCEDFFMSKSSTLSPMNPLHLQHKFKNAFFPCLLATIASVLIVSSAFAWDDEEDQDSRELGEMRDFLGAVYRGQGAMNINSRRLAQGSEGSIVRTGNTFTTPRGVYVKVGNTWFLPDGEGAVCRAGSSFLGPEGAVVKSGNTYLGDGGNAVVAGQAVFRNFRKSKKDEEE